MIIRKPASTIKYAPSPPPKRKPFGRRNTNIKFNIRVCDSPSQTQPPSWVPLIGSVEDFVCVTDTEQIEGGSQND